jgi:hypothetical protein
MRAALGIAGLFGFGGGAQHVLIAPMAFLHPAAEGAHAIAVAPAPFFRIEPLSAHEDGFYNPIAGIGNRMGRGCPENRPGSGQEKFHLVPEWHISY